MTTTTPSPAGIVCEGWTRTVLLARELAEDVDPARLSRVERLAVLALAPQLAEPLAVKHFTDFADAEQELRGIDTDDRSPGASIRRGELAVDAATALNKLLDGHPFAPEWTAGQVRPDPTYVADLVNGLREQLADRTEQLGKAKHRLADLEVANLCMEQQRDASQAAGREPAYTLTAAGFDVTNGADVLPLPVGGAR